MMHASIPLSFVFVLALFASEPAAGRSESVTVGSLACAVAYAPLAPDRIALLEDFEIAVEAKDPALGLILSANTPNDLLERSEERSEVSVTRLEGTTGLLFGAPTIIAKNDIGYARISGPELVYHEPCGLFSGPKGVHVAWRSSGSPWYGFVNDVDGIPFTKQLPRRYRERRPGGIRPVLLNSECPSMPRLPG